MSDQFILAQLSDTHIRTDDSGAAVSQLQRAMAAAHAYKADAILLTGDLVNDERADEYAALAVAIAHPPAPLYVFPGNHDERDRLRAALPEHKYLPRKGPLSFTVNDWPVRIVAVDQVTPGETYGDFTEATADWLDKTLANAPVTPTIVALHHPPFLTHDRLFDKIGLRHSELFNSVISRHRQVARIICGHHHRVVVGQVAHAPVVVAPSTSWIYGLATHAGQPVAPKTNEEPGWMLHIWRRDSGFASHFMGL
jgi:3',5'-cyclic AMP phosphodiesterase CpdA